MKIKMEKEKRCKNKEYLQKQHSLLVPIAVENEVS